MRLRRTTVGPVLERDGEIIVLDDDWDDLFRLDDIAGSSDRGAGDAERRRRAHAGAGGATGGVGGGDHLLRQP